MTRHMLSADPNTHPTRRHKRKRTAFLVVSLTGLCASTCFGGHHGSIERFCRLFGCGWGDGYHACRDGGCRPGADLPPQSYAARLARSCQGDGCGPIYPPGAGLPRPTTAIRGVAACDQTGCDAAAPPYLAPAETPTVDSGRPAPPAETILSPNKSVLNDADDSELLLPESWMDQDASDFISATETGVQNTSQPRVPRPSEPAPVSDQADSPSDRLLPPATEPVRPRQPARRLPAPVSSDQPGAAGEPQTIEAPSVRLDTETPIQGPDRLIEPQSIDSEPTEKILPGRLELRVPVQPAFPDGESLLHQAPRMQSNPFVAPTATGTIKPFRIAARPHGDGVEDATRPSDRRSPSRPTLRAPARPADWNPVRQP